MAAVWGAAIAGAVQLGSSLLGKSAAKKTAKQQKKMDINRMQIAGTAYSPVGINTPGGGGVSFGGQPQGGYSPQPSGGTFQGGQFNPATGSWTGGTGSFQEGQPGSQFGGTPGYAFDAKGKPVIQPTSPGYRQVGKYGLQSDLGNVNINLGDQEALRQLGANQISGIEGLGQSFGPYPGQAESVGMAEQGYGQMATAQGQLDPMQYLSGSALGQSYNQMNQAYQDPFAQGLQNQVMGDAQRQLGAAGQDFSQVYGNTLGLLRESARPGEEMAGANFLQRMFDTGGRATSGGAMQSQAFTKGLAEADLSRQLQAFGEARNQQNQALNVGQGLYGVGSGIRGLQDDLLTSATSRFGNLGNWAQSLSQQRFNQGQGQMAAGEGMFGLYGRYGDEATRQFAQNQKLQAGGWENALAAQKFGMLPAELAQSFMANQANSRTNQAAMPASGVGAKSAMDASFWGSVGSNAGTFGDLASSLIGKYQTGRNNQFLQAAADGYSQ